ncbi:MAG TPA: IDEAL domain-containing protein [Bacillota bacterium]
MITIKRLKPYYVKADADYVHVALAYQYFTVMIQQKVYQFVPIEASAVILNRKSKKIENTDDKFAFQKGKDIVYMSMSELISLPDFLLHVYAIAEPYFIKQVKKEIKKHHKPHTIIDELERLNVKRLIDKALDERDAETFYKLVTFL